MQLSQHFKQRKIEATFGSFRGWQPLRMPSGPQETESELETNLLIQLAFAPGVYDIITQPIIEYTKDGARRTYTPDMMVQLCAGLHGYPCRYLIEVKLLDDLEKKKEQLAEKFEIGRLCQSAVNAEFRIMTEVEIETPYLGNTRELSRYLRADLEDPALWTVVDTVAAGRISVRSLIDKLSTENMCEPDARHWISCAVAQRFVKCDLATKFTDGSMVEPRSVHSVADQDTDPLLRLLRNARNG